MKVSIKRASADIEKLQQDLNKLKQYGIKGRIIHEWPSEKLIVIDNFRESDIWRLIDIASEEGLIVNDRRYDPSDYDYALYDL